MDSWIPASPYPLIRIDYAPTKCSNVKYYHLMF